MSSPIGIAESPVESPLVDLFGRRHDYLRVSVTDRCNLRCEYCMPPEGIELKKREEILRYEEIVRLAAVFARAGVRRVRLTGGEPLLRPGIEDLVAGLTSLPGIETVAMTTNGVLLAERAAALRVAGLARLNVSLDTSRPDRFARLTLCEGHNAVLAGIEAALGAGFAPLKINVVVIGGVNDDEILDFAAFAFDKPICVRFIEYMPFRSNQWRQTRFVPCREILGKVRERYRLIPLPDPANPDRVANEFRLEGGIGGVGFIASVSDPACGRCNRLRLTADGSLKSCLFRPAEGNLRDALRSGATQEELLRRIREILARKRQARPPVESLRGAGNQSMIEIGG